jgi:hypothetical protein
MTKSTHKKRTPERPYYKTGGVMSETRNKNRRRLKEEETGT